mmetsp:Transcript_5180/g.11294  ORF Transcript_5180/g.11294 Transcript_5180/m.11294 type:complete len:261 (-) Transcript_5180:446-1228(-)
MLNPVPDLVVVGAGTQRSEEVQWLVGEGLQQAQHVFCAQSVILVHLVQDGHQVLQLRLPIELVHAAVTDEGRKHLAEVIAGDDDGGAPHQVVLPPVLTDAHSVGVVADVHQRADHNLVVHSCLCVLKVPQAGVDVINHEAGECAAHFAHVGRLPVALADEAAGCARPLVLQLSRAHDHRLHAQLLEGQLCLEGLATSLGAPDTQDEWDLGAAVKCTQLTQVVLDHVHRYFFHEPWGHIVISYDVVESPEVQVSESAVCNV